MIKFNQNALVKPYIDMNTVYNKNNNKKQKMILENIFMNSLRFKKV